jgi:hypothetical protein
MERVLVELIVPAKLDGPAIMAFIRNLLPDIDLDETYLPIEIDPRPEDTSKLSPHDKVVVIRGRLAGGTRTSVEHRKGVLHLWSDSEVEPFLPE